MLAYLHTKISKEIIQEDKKQKTVTIIPASMGVNPIQSCNRSVRVHTDDINCAPAPVHGDVGKENRRSFPQILQKQSGGHDCSLSANTQCFFLPTYPLSHYCPHPKQTIAIAAGQSVAPAS